MSTIQSAPWLYLYFAWLISLVALLGSLFFSEVMRFPPCVLCWYQRIGIYPLVAVFSVGIVYRDTNVKRYAWPLTLFGFGMACYHILVYHHLIPESITPCSVGVPCTSRQIEWFGFLSIPLLSLFSFIGIGLCLVRFETLIRRDR